MSIHDFGHDNPTKLKRFRIDAFDFDGRSDRGPKAKGYADNPMDDPSAVNESEGHALRDSLYDLLRTKADLSDAEMINQINLTDAAMERLARHFKTGVEAIRAGLDAVTMMLRDDRRAESERFEQRLSERTFRYSKEVDFMGNVMIRDSQTGAEKLVKGKESSELHHALLLGDEDEQTLLARAMGSEELREGAVQTAGADAIEFEAATFNFQWRAQGQHGFATARYSGHGDSFALEVIHVTDEHGEPIEPDPELMAAIERSAWASIDEA